MSNLANIEAGGEEEVQEQPQVEGQEQEQEEGQQEEKLLAGKYKTAEELEEGYKNLSQKLREKSPEAPEEYSFDTSALGDDYKGVEISKDDPLLQHMQGVFKDSNITDEQATKLAAEFAKYQDGNTPDPEKEMEKLGENGKETISRVENFFKKHGNAAGLTQEEVQSISSMTSTAEGVNALGKLVDRFSTMNDVPEKGQGGAAPDADELFAQANEIRKSDPSFSDMGKRKQYENLTRQAAEIKSKQK